MYPLVEQPIFFWEKSDSPEIELTVPEKISADHARGYPSHFGDLREYRLG